MDQLPVTKARASGSKQRSKASAEKPRRVIGRNGLKELMLLALASLSAHSHAVASEEVVLEELIVIGRLAEGASTASHGRITQAQLAERPLQRTGEILETVPGLVATQHSGSGKANQYFLRGFNLDHGTDFATMIDKMPVNMRTHGHGQGYTDLNFIIPELVGDMAYKKGPYYTDLGDFSGTGGVYINTAESVAADTIQVGAGKDNFARALALGSVGSGSDSRLIYGLEAQRYSGPWTDLDEDLDKKNVWLKQVWGDGQDRKNITLMYYKNSWNSADQIPERAVKQGLISELGSIDPTSGGESSRMSLSAGWSKRHGASEWDINAYFIDYEMDLFSNFTYFTNPNGDQFEQVDDRKVYGWDISYSRRGIIGRFDTTNLFGSQLRHDNIDEIGLFSSSARVRTGVYRQDKVREGSLSAYWENKTQLSENVSTTLGVRYEAYAFDVNALDAQVRPTVEQNSGSADDDIVTGSFSLVYDWSGINQSYFSAGQGYHSNDARGVVIRLDPNTGEPVDSVDPLVSTFGYELGLRSHVKDRYDASIALWHLEIDSELLFVGDEGATEDTGVGSSRQGIELTLYLHFLDRHTLDLEYAYTLAAFDEPIDGSKEVPGALDTVISAGLNSRWTEEFYSHVRMRHFGDFTLDGGAKARSSTLLNLRLGYDMSSRWSAAFDVLNLLDSEDRDIEYYYESQLPAEAAPIADRHFHLLEPRTYRLYITYRY